MPKKSLIFVNNTPFPKILLTLSYGACSNPAAGCSITDSIQSGAYRVNGNLVLNAVDLTTGASDKVLLLVSGTVSIRGSVQVDPGAFFMVVSQGNISVTSNVGRTSPYLCANQGTLNDMHIQGMFTTNENFIIEGGSTCPATDRQLNISGSIVTNADGNGSGELVNNRQLCGGDSTHPSLTVRPRPDFIFSAPPEFLRANTVWEEAAP